MEISHYVYDVHIYIYSPAIVYSFLPEGASFEASFSNLSQTVVSLKRYSAACVLTNNNAFLKHLYCCKFLDII